MNAIVSYILANNTAISAVSGVKTIDFDGNGNLVIECNDGKKLTREFSDIKQIEFQNDSDENKHLIVEYTTGEICDLGIIDAKFDINQLITTGTTEDEATDTTPLFINVDDDAVLKYKGENGNYLALATIAVPEIDDIAIDNDNIVLVDADKNKISDGIPLEDLTVYIADNNNKIGGIISVIDDDE